MGEQLRTLVNVTIHYPDGARPSGACCRPPQAVVVRFEELEIRASSSAGYDQDENYRAEFQRWVNQLWERKDQLLVSCTANSGGRQGPTPIAAATKSPPYGGLFLGAQSVLRLVLLLRSALRLGALGTAALAPGSARRLTSTRRFCARPSALALLAIGWSGPMPRVLAGAIDALRGQVGGHALRATLGQVHVVRTAAGAVGVADDLDAVLVELLERVGQVVQRV
jgi:hypothetical protein